MNNKIILIFKIIIINLFCLSANNAAETIIIPLKKPILTEDIKAQKISKNIIKPKPKPNNDIKKEKKITESFLEPKAKPKKEVEKKPEVELVKKNKILLPKSKPLIVKKEIVKIQKTSKYYKRRDFDLAKKSIQAFEKGNWTKALSLSKKARDKSIYNFIQWKHLLKSGNNASFYDYLTFINQNENYPRIGRLKYLAEHKLSTDKISPKKIINWFGIDQPLSGYGKLILGESFILKGEKKKGIQLLKDGWITAELNRSQMKFFRKKYKKYLDSSDYIKRADYLAWENKYWDLKRMLRYLPKDYQLLYTARQILMSKSYGVDQAIKNVPSKLKNDAGLNYDRLKWRRKRGRIDSSLEILLKIDNNKKYLVRPDKWWKERAIISRALIYKKKYELAYKISSKHSLESGPKFAEAEWMSGWIALSFLNDPILAIDHFNNFYQNVGYPISLSRGAYWLGKAYEEIGDNEKSYYWYEESSKFLTTYYEFPGNFTTNLRDSKKFLQITVGVSTQYDEEVMVNVESHQLALRGIILGVMSEFSEQDVAGRLGKQSLADALQEALNVFLEDKEGFGGVEGIHFTSFVLQ